MNKKCRKCLHQNFCRACRMGTAEEIEACDSFRSATRALTRVERQKVSDYWSERRAKIEKDKRRYGEEA